MLGASIVFPNIVLDYIGVVLKKQHWDGTMDIEGFVPPKLGPKKINNPSERGKCNCDHLQLCYSDPVCTLSDTLSNEPCRLTDDDCLG